MTKSLRRKRFFTYSSVLFASSYWQMKNVSRAGASVGRRVRVRGRQNKIAGQLVRCRRHVHVPHIFFAERDFASLRAKGNKTEGGKGGRGMIERGRENVTNRCPFRTPGKRKRSPFPSIKKGKKRNIVISRKRRRKEGKRAVKREKFIVRIVRIFLPITVP